MEIEQRNQQTKQFFYQSLFILGIISCHEEVVFEIKRTEETNEEYIFIKSIGSDENEIEWNDIVRMEPNEITTEEIAHQMNNYLFDILQFYGYEYYVVNNNHFEYILSLSYKNKIVFLNQSIQFIGSFIHLHLNNHYGYIPIQLNKHSDIIQYLFSSILLLS